ncbi:protein STPG4 [Salminus brasiliensis]|uniref:protein STPG4 n=1 Tax=Salminus brasiliensis TaxID=930266 RepID=UPI003B833FB6
MPIGRESAAAKLGDIPPNSNVPETSREKEDLADRSGWWRQSIKDTPIPGSYHIRDFIEEASLNPVRRTYGFKGTGRSTQAACVRSGAVLLPGAYKLTDSTQEALQRQASYSFKSCPRPDSYTLGIRDKDVDLSPCHYNVTEKPVPKLPCKHVMFRSAVQRLSFLPKEGPPPGHYTIRSSPANGITSCFRSTVPRLHSVRSRTPGPGTYEPSWQRSPWLATEASVGPTYGLYFRNVF